MSNNDDFDKFDPYDPYNDLTDLTGSERVPALEHPMTAHAVPPRSPLLSGLIVGLLLMVLSIGAFRLLGNSSDAPTDTTTTSVTSTDAPVATNDTSVTVEDTSTTTTTIPPANPVDEGLPPFEALGDPISISDLRLAADGIGPIKLGAPATESIGSLIASLGTPDNDTGAVTSTGQFGACEGDTERIIRWGPFAAVVIVDADGTQTLGGYRLDQDYGTGDASQLTTLSGLKLASSVAVLESIYEAFDVSYRSNADLGNIYELRSANTDTLLLWGPVSGSDSTRFVRGIYSPNACGVFS